MKTTLKLIAAATLLASGGFANAGPISIFSHTINNTSNGTFDGVNTRGGDVSRIKTTYNETEQTFSYSYDVAPAISNGGRVNGQENDAFWLVISDGPDPKYDSDEYAILFGDLDTGRLTAYLYSGTNSSDSWMSPGVLLESYAAGTIVTTPKSPDSDVKTVSFEIDVAGLNTYSPEPDASGDVLGSSGAPWVAEDWDGVLFGETVGIWFHPTVKTSIEYDNDDRITRFRPISGGAGFYDGKDIVVRHVPEPGILYLSGLGLLAFRLSRNIKIRSNFLQRRS